MRWMRPRDRDFRIIRRFALFPICINREYCWLETVYIEQKYNDYALAWVNKRFVDPGEWIKYRKELADEILCDYTSVRRKE